ncbi:hypothetical protein RJ639_024873 [Escallonia herrerae]|uniref:RNase H type-1 domain-containing protein n=1 Tax=Escallonia herrerae TaxID=1293975 RepID=A0AA88SR41_9ASTE|nr:hypothetical protein RJ639_024873 [Escallonia herrerae]
MDIFTWTATDISGIDPKVITHKLNVDLSKKHVKQRKGTFAPETHEKIEEEVDKLLTANFIAKIYYPDWIANASNNEAEYEAFLIGIRLAHTLKVDSLSVHNDSQLVNNHVLGDYEARDERIVQYLQLLKTLASKFKHFTIRQIPQDQNTQENTLSRLASTEVTEI